MSRIARILETVCVSHSKTKTCWNTLYDCCASLNDKSQIYCTLMWSIIICQALIYPQHFGYSWKKWKQLESSSPSPLFQYNHSNSFLLLFSYEYRVNPERCRPTVPTITSVVVQILQLLSLYCTKDGQKGAFLQKMQASLIDKLWKLDGPGMGQYWIKSAPAVWQWIKIIGNVDLSLWKMGLFWSTNVNGIVNGL